MACCDKIFGFVTFFNFSSNLLKEIKQKWFVFYFKMAIKVTLSKNACHQEYYLCGKFHDFTKKVHDLVNFGVAPLY